MKKILNKFPERVERKTILIITGEKNKILER